MDVQLCTETGWAEAGGPELGAGTVHPEPDESWLCQHWPCGLPITFPLWAFPSTPVKWAGWTQ